MKTIVMTGGTAGFGAVAAKRISNTPNTKLILGARDNKNSSIETLPLDLARLSNVRSFVQSLTKKLDGAKIDILIMNAGAQFGNTRHRTEDGFESTFAINHLAHYLLLRLLTPGLAKNATIVITTSDVHDPSQVPFGPKELDPESLAHPKDKSKGFGPGIRAYASSKLCNILTARAFEASSDAQINGMQVIAYNPGLTPGTSLFRAWPWWAKLMMGVASKLRPVNTIEQAGNAITYLGLGTIVPPSGRIYASLVKGKLTWPDPSELAQSNAAMRELWVESAQISKFTCDGAQDSKVEFKDDAKVRPGGTGLRDGAETGHLNADKQCLPSAVVVTLVAERG